MTETSGNRAILIDAHSHMDAYDEGALDQALAEISEHRILTLSTAMDIPSFEKASGIARACEWIVPTFGIHPWRAMEYADRLEGLDPYIEQSPMLGELGLDYYYISDRKTYPAQRKVFEYFLSAAREQEKIVNIHTKGAERDAVDALRRFGIDRAIVHWYSGPFDTFDELVDLGAYFTVGVEIGYSSHIEAIARDIPMDRLLTETDNPSGMTWQNGDLGMPLHINHPVKALAGLLDMSMEEVVRTVQANFARLIRDDPRLSDIYLKLASPVDSTD